jgi:hypothetical protein
MASQTWAKGARTIPGDEHTDSRDLWAERGHLPGTIAFPKDESVLVRLIDAYPNEAPPLPFATLTSESGTLLFVKRDVQCDRPFGELLLRTAPGDAMAILPERLGYQPQMIGTPNSDNVVPCYRTLRH